MFLALEGATISTRVPRASADDLFRFSFRENLRNLDYTKKGEDTVANIYRGVGNSEVREMTQQYFPDMCMS